MKKFLKACISAVLLPLCFLFAGCKIKPQNVFYKNTGVKLPTYEYDTVVDTTGFFGDGALIYTFKFNDENAQELLSALESAEHWSRLPMNETVDYMLYEFSDSGLPRVQTGYYFFYDEQRKSYSPVEDYIESSYSFDYIVALFDSKERVMYYFEMHT